MKLHWKGKAAKGTTNGKERSRQTRSAKGKKSIKFSLSQGGGWIRDCANFKKGRTTDRKPRGTKMPGG